jgi:hypothetical protein
MGEAGCGIFLLGIYFGVLKLAALLNDARKLAASQQLQNDYQIC